MGNFTVLTDADVACLCETFGLGELLSVQPIAAGTINSNYQVDTASGRYFLRVNEGKSESEVQLEVAILSHLVAGGVPTLLPLSTVSGVRYASFASKLVSVFPWQDGTHSDSKSISDNECAAVGAALAQLHLAGTDMECTHAGRYTLEVVRQEYKAFAESTDSNLASACRALEEEFAWLDARQAKRSSYPEGLIHADLFPDNVLMQDGRVVALLDFEQACAGAYCYDVAVCLNAWCFAEELVPGRLEAFLRGYQQVRPLSAAEAEGLQTEARAAAVRFLVTRIRDIYLPAPEQEPGDKDFRRFLMRLSTWRALAPNQLAVLSEATLAV